MSINIQAEREGRSPHLLMDRTEQSRVILWKWAMSVGFQRKGIRRTMRCRQNDKVRPPWPVEGVFRLPAASPNRAPTALLALSAGAQLSIADDRQDSNCLQGEHRTINKTSTPQESKAAKK